jgi:hypothetical protein
MISIGTGEAIKENIQHLVQRSDLITQMLETEPVTCKNNKQLIDWGSTK